MNCALIECKATLRNRSTKNRIEVRRFYLSERASSDLVRLHEDLAVIFVRQSTPFEIYWTDEVGDDIVIRTNSELKLAFEAMAGRKCHIIVEPKPTGNAFNESVENEQQILPQRRTIDRRLSDLEGEMSKVKEEMSQLTKLVHELRGAIVGFNRGPFPAMEE